MLLDSPATASRELHLTRSPDMGEGVNGWACSKQAAMRPNPSVLPAPKMRRRSALACGMLAIGAAAS